MADQIFHKKTEYGTNPKDFIGESEIAITITLSEYRELVSNMATADKDIRDASHKASEARIKADELQKENAELKAELYELQKAFETSKETVNPVEEESEEYDGN